VKYYRKSCKTSGGWN